MKINKTRILIVICLVLAILTGTALYIVIQRESKYVDLSGKRIACYGDSITWGQMQAKLPYISDVSYPSTFVRLTGCSAGNFGIGSTCMATVGNTDVDPNAMVNRIDTEDLSAFDYLLICYGTNDCNNSVAIGDDRTPYLKNTFKGAINYILDTAKEKYPDLKIVLISPMFGNISLTKNYYRNLTLNDYASAVQEEAQRHNLPFVDLQNGMGINASNYQTMYWDGALHPTEETYVLMGKFIAESLKGQL